MVFRSILLLVSTLLTALLTTLLAALMVGSAMAAGSKPVVLRYPRPVSENDRRSDYPLKLLQLALDRSGQNYRLTPTSAVMNKARVAAELASGALDVGWMVTSIEREQQLLPIRICLFKGLGGWRVALIHQRSLAEFATVNSLPELRRFVAGQQQDWPDTGILRHSGIRVETSSSYDPLFHMLAAGRFDWFPRNVLEVWAEAEDFKSLGIVADPHVLLRYPSAYYFFVNRRDIALAQAIETGLEAALKDGSFDRLLRSYHREVIALAKLKRRVVIDIPNPSLPPQTPLHRKALWFQLDED